MNATNWVGLGNSFVEHCSPNTETVGSNPVKALSFCENNCDGHSFRFVFSLF